MTKVTRTKQEDYDVYIAEDGSEFSTEFACTYHESRKGLQQVWVITQHANENGEKFMGVFSSREYADEWMNELAEEYQRNFVVRSEYLDNRIFENRLFFP